MKNFRKLICCFILAGLSSIFLSNTRALNIKPVPGEMTLKNFIATSLSLVGKVMYAWGGGWNPEDTGSGRGSTTIGPLPEWKEFYLKQDKNYKFTQEKSEDTGAFLHIYDGLDCSGFVGWTIYNTLNTENNKEGYVMPSTKMASEFAKRGWGKFTRASEIKKHMPGDIMSGKGHVYICLGECEDGSLLLVHSSPNGVQICGTTTRDGNRNSLAIKNADNCMKTHYPEWYARYPECWRGANYFNFDQMSWHVNGEPGSILSDPDNIQQMTAEQVLKLFFA